MDSTMAHILDSILASRATPCRRRLTRGRVVSGLWYGLLDCARAGVDPCDLRVAFFFKQKPAYEIGLGIPAEPLFRSSSARRSASGTRSVTASPAWKIRRTAASA